MKLGRTICNLSKKPSTQSTFIKLRSHREFSWHQHSGMHMAQNMQWEFTRLDVSTELRAILGYLLEHPQATDTLDGVLWWWLLEEDGTKWSHSQIHEALECAVRDGLMLGLAGADGRKRYRLAPGKLAEVHQLLHSNQGRDQSGD